MANLQRRKAFKVQREDDDATFNLYYVVESHDTSTMWGSGEAENAMKDLESEDGRAVIALTNTIFAFADEPDRRMHTISSD
jgi:hypothetical protein